jgi:hypothetical protein
MKLRILAMALAIAFGSCFSLAQTPLQASIGLMAAQAEFPGPNTGTWGTQKWVGMWQGQLDGQPGVIITLVEDDGQLGGTAVFNAINREGGPHVIASEPHMLMATTSEGDVLHFQIKGLRDRRDLHFEMKATADDKAQLKCLNCDDAPETEVVRAPVYPRKD